MELESRNNLTNTIFLKKNQQLRYLPPTIKIENIN